MPNTASRNLGLVRSARTARFVALMGHFALCMVVTLISCTSALHTSLALPRAKVVHHRTGIPRAASTKLFSRNRLDFASQDHAEHEFGLQGHIFGLAPQADSYVLLSTAYLIARYRALPLADLAFAIGFPAYLAISNWCLFDCNLGYERPYKPLLREGRGAWLKRYILTYALLGLLLPLPIVLMAPPTIAIAAAPHLFLTLVQCACEGLTSHRHFAVVLRLAVPFGFNVYRLAAIQVWVASALAAVRVSTTAGLVASTWAWASLSLAVANGAVWSYNLFVFLLLRVAPQYLDSAISVTPRTFEWRWGLLPRRIVPDEHETEEAAELAASVAGADGGSGSIG